MGVGVVILLYGFAYVVAAALLSLVAWPFKVLLNHRSKLIFALRLAPFVIPGIPPTVGLGALVWTNLAPPPYIYRSAFDRLPDSTVFDLHGQSSGFNDYQEVFLSFRDSDTAFQRALATARFEFVGATGSNNLVPMPGESAPQWWMAGHCGDRTVYVAQNVRGWDKIVMTQCRSDATIYVQARWID